MTDIQPRPTLGMGVTKIMWSDRYAGTIIAISPSGETITIQHDTCIRVDTNGMSGSQTYTYEPNTKGVVEKYSLRKNGMWVKVGDTLRGSHLKLGVRRAYYDFSC